MNTYTGLKVFIATPSDLNQERNLFLNVVSEVNQIKANPMGYFLQPIGWEVTMPGMGRPQELINKDLLECDLIIVAFWEKWGSPTGEYSSGTEEEFEVAKKSYESIGKPDIFLLFKEQSEDKNEDMIKINSFKERVIKDRSLMFRQFKSSIDWQNELRQLLCKWLDNMSSLGNSSIANSELDGLDILYEVSYQDWIGSGLMLKPEIYYTIKDSNSLAIWKALTIDNKKKFIYDNISKHLGLTLGAPMYSGVLRFQRDESTFILLGTIARKYKDTIDESTIYIPNGYNQLCNKSKYETIFDGHIGRI